MTIASVAPPPRFFITGGTLARDAASYVVRPADQELLMTLQQGWFCYVLTSRQMGKSSLMVRTAARLRETTGVAVLDLTAIGQNLTAEQWYDGLLERIGEQLGLESELGLFWRTRAVLGPLQRWMAAIREVVLPQYPARVVIFVDEIDTLRSLPFPTDEFVAGIREFYNRRSEDRELERLTFCLLGVATPADLMRDRRSTPFNIGRRIELHDFTANDASPLSHGLSGDVAQGTSILERVLHWTGGHPYLTQRLCQAVADANVNDVDGIDRTCREVFFRARAQERDDNLLFVRDRLLHTDVDLTALLTLYGRVWRGERVLDNETDPLVSVLRLSGIVTVDDNRLRVRNRIYARVFDDNWIATAMPGAELRRQHAAYRRGVLRASGIAAVTIFIVALLGLWAFSQRNRAAAEAEARRRLLYAANMQLASRAWDDANPGTVAEILETARPAPGEKDLRGWEWYYLYRMAHPRVVTLRHDAGVNAVAFSPSGKLIAVAGGRSIRLWSPAGNEQKVLRVQDEVGAVRFSPNGQLLAAATENAVIVWRLPSFDAAFTLSAEMASDSLAFSPDGQLLATRDANRILFWDTATGAQRRTIKDPGVRSLAFSPDSAMLASAIRTGPEHHHLSERETISVWNVQDGSLRTKLPEHAGVRDVAFVSNRVLASAGWGPQGALRLWDVASASQVTQLGRTDEDITSSLNVSPDGRLLAVAGFNRQVRLWEVASGRLNTTIRGHNMWVSNAAFSPDGRMLVTGGGDGVARIWDLASPPQQERILTSAVAGDCQLSPDGRLVAVSGRDGVIRLIETHSGVETGSLDAGGLASLAFSPDGTRLASMSGGVRGTLAVWDVATRQRITVLNGAPKDEYVTVSFSRDGRRLAVSGYTAPAIEILDVGTGRRIATIERQERLPVAIGGQFDRDGHVIAENSPGQMAVWALDPLRVVRTFKAHDGFIGSFSVSLTNDRLITGGADALAKIWDTHTGALLAVMRGHGQQVTSVAWSSDGSRIFTGSFDSTVKVWAAETGKELASFRSGTTICCAPGIVGFLDDGQSMMTFDGGDGAFSIWRTASPEEVRADELHRSNDHQ